MIKIGSIVRFLNSVGGGKVVKIDGQIAYVEDEDGFENPTLLRECVLVDEPIQLSKMHNDFVDEQTTSQNNITTASDIELPIEETPEGEKINLVLAFEPDNIKQLSHTTFYSYLVNDSNYFLYFTYSSKSKDSNQWNLKYSGLVEPNVQLLLESFVAGDLVMMDNILIQYVAFKKDKPFNIKSPASVEFSFDTTKFAKLHCFKDSVYFDTQVISVDLVKNDTPYKQAKIQPTAIEEALRAKVKADTHTKKRIIKKQPKIKRSGEKIVVDLHINELVDNTNGLSNADMLNLQIDEFTRVMDENKKNIGQKIIFIHGKGEGVLRNAIMKELTHRYKGNDVQDASFQEYGYGATQVTIK